MTESQPEWAKRLEAKVDACLDRLSRTKCCNDRAAGEIWGAPTNTFPWGEEEQ